MYVSLNDSEGMNKMINTVGRNEVASLLDDINKKECTIVAIDELKELKRCMDDKITKHDILYRMSKILLIMMSLSVYIHETKNVSDYVIRSKWMESRVATIKR